MTLTGTQRIVAKLRTTFQLSLINGSDQTCMARVTKTNFELKIYSGSDRIWSTADCPSVIKPISRKLGSEHAVAWTLTWDGKRSKPDCGSARGESWSRFREHAAELARAANASGAALQVANRMDRAHP